MTAAHLPHGTTRISEDGAETFCAHCGCWHIHAHGDAQLCTPLTFKEHLERINAWVDEAAADLQMDPEVVWHDVTISYLQLEVPEPGMRRRLAIGLGIPPDVVAQ